MARSKTDEFPPREAARRYDIPLDYLYRLIWDGRLNARRRDGRWFVSAGSLEAYKRKAKKRKRLHRALGCRTARSPNPTERRSRESEARDLPLFASLGGQ